MFKMKPLFTSTTLAVAVMSWILFGVAGAQDGLRSAALKY